MKSNNWAMPNWQMRKERWSLSKTLFVGNWKLQDDLKLSHQNLKSVSLSHSPFGTDFSFFHQPLQFLSLPHTQARFQLVILALWYKIPAIIIYSHQNSQSNKHENYVGPNLPASPFSLILIWEKHYYDNDVLIRNIFKHKW